MQQIKWFERTFQPNPTQNILPATLERLAGTPLRLIDKVSRIEEDVLIAKPADGSWSIQENVGHLLDLEILWHERLEDILNGKKYLREYDLNNGPTEQANHNTTDLEDLLVNFTIYRRQLLDGLAGLPEADLFKTALHPRLQQPLSIQALALFIADHDDHHLARITQLTRG